MKRYAAELAGNSVAEAGSTAGASAGAGAAAASVAAPWSLSAAVRVVCARTFSLLGLARSRLPVPPTAHILPSAAHRAGRESEWKRLLFVCSVRWYAARRFWCRCVGDMRGVLELRRKTFN